MRILLIGIGGVYNYGCEAIVRGTVAMLRKTIPQAYIIYASLDFERDCAALKDLSIQIVNARPKKFTRRWAWERVRRRAGLQRKFGPWVPGMLPQCDVALSIGGDIYTIDANTAQEGYSHPLVEVGEYLISKGVKYVLWGASVGPFSKFPEIEEYYHKHLKKCALVTVREEITEAYLDQLGEIKTVKVADPAFWMSSAVQADAPAKREKIRIGLNLSRLSIEQCYPRSEWDQQEARLIRSIKELSAMPDTELLLVPHVQPGNGSEDDDYAFLSEVKTSLHAGNVQILQPCLGAPRTKAIVAECDVLIAARMHCAIAGVSMGVPTLFLAYSPKALGMAEYIYGHRGYCFDLNQINGASLMKTIGEILHKSQEISGCLTERRKIWEKEAMSAVDALREMVLR